MSLILGSPSLIIVNLIVGLFYVIGLRLSVQTTEDLEALLVQAVIDAMHAAHLTYKDLAFYLKVDQATLSRQLSRQPHYKLPLLPMIHLPFGFWMHFGPALMLVVWKKRWQELQDEARDLVKVK